MANSEYICWMLTLNFHPFPDLATERLTLRKMVMDDAPELLLMRSDERVMEFLDRPRLQSLEEARAFMQRVLTQEDNNEAITWAISLKGESRMIGNICFWQIEKENYRAEVGYMIHAEYHGMGIMTEAIRAVVHHGFRKLGFHSVQANVNPANIASIKVLEKNGFVKEAHFRENYFFNGRFLDSAIYSLLTPLR